MLRLISLALLGNVAMSAISFRGLSNCRSKTAMVPANDGTTTAFMTYDDFNEMNAETQDYTPIEHTGFDSGYYVL